MRLNELVATWMSEPPVTVPRHAPIMTAYALMADHGIRHLPVVEGDRLVGVVSDRDLHRKASLRDACAADELRPLLSVPVGEIMTREGLLTVRPDTTMAEAASKLIAARVGSLPVVDGDRLVGILTTYDLLRALVDLERWAVAEPV